MPEQRVVQRVDSGESEPGNISRLHFPVNRETGNLYMDSRFRSRLHRFPGCFSRFSFPRLETRWGNHV